MADIIHHRAHVVAGGFPPGSSAGHDHDYARLRLLTLLAERQNPASVASDFADMEKWLNGWIMNYVDGDPANSSETTKAQKPLAAAEVVVEESPGAPGYYSSKFFLRPHYQLEGLTVSLRLVSKLPSGKKQ